jgi:hypothetical protein
MEPSGGEPSSSSTQTGPSSTPTGKRNDKKENQIFLIYKEIQNEAVVKLYMTNGLLIYGEIFAHFLIYKEALPHLVRLVGRVQSKRTHNYSSR